MPSPESTQPQNDPSLTAGVTDPSLMAGSTLTQSEFLQAGIAKFTESLSAVAEGGPADIQAYMSEVLADTSGTVPLEERAVAFGILAEAQKTNMKAELVGTGKNMLAHLEENDTATSPQLKQYAERTRSSKTTLLDGHQQFGSSVRNGVDASKLGQKYEAVSATAQQYGGNLITLAAHVAVWRKQQQAEVTKFDAKANQTATHQRALQEADKTLSPDYNGEAKDLSRAIDETVNAKVAETLFSQIQAAAAEGKPFESVVESLLTRTPDATQDRAIKVLRGFRESYSQLLHVQDSKVQQMTPDVTQGLSRFRTRGRDEYPVAKRAGEAEEIYRQQTRSLLTTTENGDIVVRAATNVLTASIGEIGKVRQALGAKV